MSAKIKRNIALLSMTATTGLILPWAADAKRPEEAEPARPPAARAEHAAPSRGPSEAADRAAQAQERSAQMAEVRAQQEQAKQQHEQAMQQGAQARQQQEQSLREQEQQSRKAQQEAQKAQQEQARQAQEQARQAQEQVQRQQPHGEPGQGHEQQRAAMIEHGPGGPGGEPAAARNESMGRPGGSAAFARDRSGNPVLGRAAAPPQLSAPRLALQKAIAMPVLAPGASAADQAHLLEVQNNLQQHMYAVPAAYAPSNFNSMPNFAQQAYFNNYQAMIGNQQFIINRQNTFLNALEQSQWPVWYQPQPGWQFVNGFTLGNAINADLNWLRWGWHPYYGPQPEGFVCASNYVPTPWIYMPAYGTWRQPGVNAYAAYGPPFDYTGPISVEVFEPRRVSVDIPFGGFLPQRVINVVYFYNAYYYPEFGRYGYMNRHDNWIWLNLGTQPF